MLRIRDEQKKALAEAAARRFEQRMRVHLIRFFPKQCSSLGDEELGRFIHQGVERAGSHQVRSARDMCKYLDLAMVLGRDFDRDPRLPWAQEILGEPPPPGIDTRVGRLHDRAMSELRAAAGVAAPAD